MACEGRPAPENNPCAVCGATAVYLTPKMRRLVIAARRVAYDDDTDTDGAIAELDRAVEAFAADVPWEDAPTLSTTPGREEIAERLSRIRTSMAMLQQNAEGCAMNHYGGDHELFGMPGWLADTGKDLADLTAILSLLRKEGAQ